MSDADTRNSAAGDPEPQPGPNQPGPDQPSPDQSSPDQSRSAQPRSAQPSRTAQYAPGEVIDLQDYLKLVGLVDTGGEAKYLIQIGEVRLNGEVETRRRKKIRRGDTVKLDGREHMVDF